MINVEMLRLPPVGGVPLEAVRRSSGRATAAAARQNWQHIARRVQEQRPIPPEDLWEISSGSERLILDWCCR